MEKLKDPAMILAAVDAVAILGITTYFYKEIATINSDLVKVSNTISGIVKKLGEMEKSDQHKTDALRDLNGEVKELSERIADLPSFDEFNSINIDMDEIVATLQDNNIAVERPSQIPRTVRRSGDRRTPRTTDVEPYERVRSGTKTTVRGSTRDYDQKPRTQQPQDDSDIIGDVRRQQPRS